MSPMLVLAPNLVEAKPLDGYVVHLRFADGLAADVDLSYLVGCGEVFDHVQRADYEQRCAAAAR